MAIRQQYRGASHRTGHAGQSLAELAFMLPILLIILMGVLDLGRSFYTYVTLTNAAREAARYAAVNNLSASSAKVALEHTAAGATFNGCVDGSLTFSGSLTLTGAEAQRGQLYRVNVSCKFQLLTPLMGGIVGADSDNRITITSTASFVID